MGRVKKQTSAIDITKNITDMISSGQGVDIGSKPAESNTVEEQIITNTPAVSPGVNTQQSDRDSMIDFLKGASQVPTVNTKQNYSNSSQAKRPQSVLYTQSSSDIDFKTLFNNSEFRNMVGDIIYDISKKAIQTAVDDIIDMYEESFDNEEDEDEEEEVSRW